MECSFYDVPCWAGWLTDEIYLLLVDLYASVLGGVVLMLSAIPAPSFLTSLGSLSIPSSVLFFADVFEVNYGLGIVVSAYTIRFLIRRIPVIG